MIIAWPTLALLFGSVAYDAWTSGVLVIPKGRGLYEHTVARATEPSLFFFGVGVLAILAAIFASGAVLLLAALLRMAPDRVMKAFEASFHLWDSRTPTRWHPLWLLVIVSAVAAFVYVAA